MSFYGWVVFYVLGVNFPFSLSCMCMTTGRPENSQEWKLMGKSLVRAVWVVALLQLGLLLWICLFPVLCFWCLCGRLHYFSADVPSCLHVCPTSLLPHARRSAFPRELGLAGWLAAANWVREAVAPAHLKWTLEESWGFPAGPLTTTPSRQCLPQPESIRWRLWGRTEANSSLSRATWLPVTPREK